MIATMGTESSRESASPVTRLVAPGPEVAMHTPTSPVVFAYPSAAKISPCNKGKAASSCVAEDSVQTLDVLQLIGGDDAGKHHGSRQAE